eukprot:1141549-Pelagomonas_calceolata.AAC.2
MEGTPWCALPLQVRCLSQSSSLLPFCVRHIGLATIDSNQSNLVALKVAVPSATQLYCKENPISGAYWLGCFLWCRASAVWQRQMRRVWAWVCAYLRHHLTLPLYRRGCAGKMQWMCLWQSMRAAL